MTASSECRPTGSGAAKIRMNREQMTPPRLASHPLMTSAHISCHPYYSTPPLGNTLPGLSRLRNRSENCRAQDTSARADSCILRLGGWLARCAPPPRDTPPHNAASSGTPAYTHPGVCAALPLLRWAVLGEEYLARRAPPRAPDPGRCHARPLPLALRVRQAAFLRFRLHGGMEHLPAPIKVGKGMHA